MNVRLDLVGIVARDMGASLSFYRRLDLDIPEGVEDEPHVEATTPSCLRIAWDTAELIRQIGHKEPWDAFWGQRYASVKDPDGNQIDLFAPL